MASLVKVISSTSESIQVEDDLIGPWGIVRGHSGSVRSFDTWSAYVDDCLFQQTVAISHKAAVCLICNSVPSNLNSDVVSPSSTVVSNWLVIENGQPL